MPKKKPEPKSRYDDAIDLELYVRRSTKKSGVPLDVRDARVLQLVIRLLPKR